MDWGGSRILWREVRAGIRRFPERYFWVKVNVQIGIFHTNQCAKGGFDWTPQSPPGSATDGGSYQWNESGKKRLQLKRLSQYMLCAPVFIFTSGSTLWFIDLTVATCHIQYTFLSLCQCFSRENGQNMRSRSPLSSYVTKMAADGY